MTSEDQERADALAVVEYKKHLLYLQDAHKEWEEALDADLEAAVVAYDLKHGTRTKKAKPERNRLYSFNFEFDSTYFLPSLREHHKARQRVFKSKRTYNLISPAGEPVTIDNISALARQHGLDQGAMSHLLKGKIKQHKGWTVAPVAQPGQQQEVKANG